MGFLDSFFGHAAANAYSEMKREEKETEKWNDLFHELSQYESAFTEFLRSVGSQAIYCFDVEYVNSGNITPEKRIMDNYRKKVNDYLAIGGDGRLIYDLDDLDDFIEKVKFLKKKGCMDRQREFIDTKAEAVKEIIAEEEHELEEQQNKLRENQKIERQQEINQIVGADINLLGGIEFENVCQQLVENMGFRTETTKASGDGGIDLIAYNNQPLLSGKYIIQCKRYSGSVGEPIIRDLYGVVMSERANKGILMTTGYFTNSAISFAEGKPIELIDGQKLGELLTQNDLLFSEENEEPMEQENFNLEEFLGYDGEEYRDLVQLLKVDAGDIRTRCKIVELVDSQIKMHAHCHNDTELYNMAAVKALEEYVVPLIEISRGSRAAKNQYIYYVGSLICAQCAFWKGDFYTTVELYSKVLDEWKDLYKDSNMFQAYLLDSIFSIFTILEMPEYIARYAQKYASILEEYNKYSSDRKINADNKGNLRFVISLSLAMPNDEGNSILYDEAIDEWGEINIPYGRLSFEINRFGDCLETEVKNFNTNEVSTMKIITDLASCVKVSKSKF